MIWLYGNYNSHLTVKDSSFTKNILLDDEEYTGTGIITSGVAGKINIYKSIFSDNIMKMKNNKSGIRAIIYAVESEPEYSGNQYSTDLIIAHSLFTGNKGMTFALVIVGLWDDGNVYESNNYESGNKISEPLVDDCYGVGRLTQDYYDYYSIYYSPDEDYLDNTECISEFSKTAHPTLTPTGTSVRTPTIPQLPIASEHPTISLTFEQTRLPSVLAKSLPSSFPTGTQTNKPTRFFSHSPSIFPSMKPNPFISTTPTSFQSKFPTLILSAAPTHIPSDFPSYSSSSKPSHFASNSPTYTPTQNLSKIAISFPSSYPTLILSAKPTLIPSEFPSYSLSLNPSRFTSDSPTYAPSQDPSKIPISFPSSSPNLILSVKPTHTPSEFSSYSLSLNPSRFASNSLTYAPSQAPSKKSNFPSSSPTLIISARPTRIPSFSPTFVTSQNPSQTPTFFPTKNNNTSSSKHPTVDNEVTCDNGSGFAMNIDGIDISCKQSKKDLRKYCKEDYFKNVCRKKCGKCVIVTNVPTINKFQPTPEQAKEPTKKPSNKPEHICDNGVGFAFNKKGLKKSCTQVAKRLIQYCRRDYFKTICKKNCYNCYP